MSIFENGKTTSLEEILLNREWRVAQQKLLMKEFKDANIVAVKLNIPGDVKSSSQLIAIFKQVWRELKSNAIQETCFSERVTGPEGFLVFEGDLQTIKKQMIQFEEENPLGRLFDLDVMDFQNETKQLSRTALGFPQRSCYICAKSAKECTRDRSHSLDEIKSSMDRIVENAK